VSMDDILDQLEKAASREAGSGSIAISRAYADWGRIGLEEYRRDVVRSGVDTVQVFSVGKAEKNAADIVLVVDCLRAAADLEHLEVFILVSADGDFVPLVRRLHELDKYVIGATLANHPVNSVLEKEVDQYVPLKVKTVPPAAALQPVFSADPTAKPAKKVAPAKKAAAKTPPEKPKVEQVPANKATRNPPRTAPAGGAPKAPPTKKHAAPVVARSSGKANWHDMASEIPVVHKDAAKSPADYKAIVKKVLNDSKVRSFCDKLANQGGTLPILAMALKAAAPKLSPSDAKVSSLSRALRFALADTQYALARESDDVQPVLVRRQNNPTGMLPDLSLDDIARGVQ
ncbi:MAG: NYN domain-containing protein, partial [Aeromicrobium sp.]